MRDRPNGAAVLDVVQRSLLDEVAPALKGQPRYVALMVANAMGIAARELEEAVRFERAQSAVVAQATRDAGAPVNAAIGGVAPVRPARCRRRALQRAERQPSRSRPRFGNPSAPQGRLDARTRGAGSIHLVSSQCVILSRNLAPSRLTNTPMWPPDTTSCV